MKKIFYLLFALLLAIGLAACGGDSASKEPEQKPADNDKQDEAETEDEGGGDAAVDYPTRDITVLVGHGAGGGTDTFSRQISKEMEKILGVNMNVINQEGAGGVIAKENGANEPADGYTIVATSSMPIQVAIGTNDNAQLNVYKAIARVQSDTMALQVKSGTYANLEEFIEDAKANPGKLKIGGTGVGVMDDMVFQMFVKEAGIDVIYVPIDGAGQMHAQLLGGHIDAMLEEPGPTISMIEAGEVDPILFFNEDRLDDFPDVPSSVEMGWDITNGVERGFLIHKDTPQEIIDILEAAMKEAKDSPEYKEYEKNSYLHLREGWLGSDDYTDKLQADIDAFTEIVESLDR